MWKTFVISNPSNRRYLIQFGIIPLIEELLEQDYISSYSYNCYGGEIQSIELRLELSPEKSWEDIKKQMRNLSKFVIMEKDYTASSDAQKAYELGSRWASVLWLLDKEGKINRDQLDNLNFRYLALHGLFNSLDFGYGAESLSYCFGLFNQVIKSQIPDPIVQKVALALYEACIDYGLFKDEKIE